MIERHENGPESAPKPPTLAEAREFIETAADGKGLGLDEGIKETVVGLMTNGVGTRQSCEGHVDRGVTFPWVTISAPEPDGMRDDDSGLLHAQWREANLRERPKLDALLDEFYAGRESDIHLGSGDPDPRDGITTLMPYPQPYPAHQPEMMPVFQAEMNAFTEFLVAKAETAEGTAAASPDKPAD